MEMDGDEDGDENRGDLQDVSLYCDFFPILCGYTVV